MKLIVIGLNHKTAPLEVRERFSFTQEQLPRVLDKLSSLEGVSEALLLATCNRTELYAVLDDPEAALPLLKEEVGQQAGGMFQSNCSADQSDTRAGGMFQSNCSYEQSGTQAGANFPFGYFYNLSGTQCVRHLFRVAASLDSLIVGEGQILNQLKSAYQTARLGGHTDVLLNTLLNRAIAVGKKVRTETKIAYNSVSVSSAAVDLAKKILGDLSQARILVVGAGTMSELTARHLIDKGARSIIVSNRNYAHAQELARKFGGQAIPYRELFNQATAADIIITSTGAPHYILTAENLGPLLPARQGRPLVLIDIAVPRDVDPRLGEMEGVTVYNIDDLENVVDNNRQLRAGEALLAEQLIEEELLALKERLRYYRVRPVMVRLHDKMNFYRQHLLKKAFIKLPGLREEERRLIEQFSKRLEHKFLREPMMALNAVAGTEQEEEYKLWLGRIFHLDEEGEEFGDENRIENWD